MIGTALLLAALGYALGARGTFKPRATSTPLARIGFVLAPPAKAAEPRDWEALARDVQVVRSGLKPHERGPFELVVALRGLESAGTPNWEQAETWCKRSSWARCDRAGLEALAKRATP